MFRMANLVVSTLVFVALGISSSLAQVTPSPNYRPQLHFSPSRGWMNDPNGLVYYNGEYHLHYQYDPNGTVPSQMNWGHAVSNDLLRWRELGVALAPDNLGVIFSGSAVVDTINSAGFRPQLSQTDAIVAMFTHFDPANSDQKQSLAYSLDFGRSYVKFSGNPVINNTVEIREHFRDPKVLRYGDKWVAVLASDDRMRIYESEDMLSWRYLSDFGGANVGSQAGVWECPDLFELEDEEGNKKWVMLVSIDATREGGPNLGSATQYFVGSFNGTHFIPEHTNILWMDWGPDNYASVSFSNVANRTVIIGWMSNWLYARSTPTGVDGWRGQMTVPRELSLRNVSGNHRLVSVPIRELASLRDEVLWQIPENISVGINDDGQAFQIEGVNSTLLHASFSFSTFATVNDSSIQICATNGLGQEICTGFHKLGHQLYPFIDRSRSGSTDFGDMNQTFYHVAVAERELDAQAVDIEIFLDVSSIEVMIDGGLTWMTSIFYPDEPFTSLEIRHTKPSGVATTSILVLSRGQVERFRSTSQLPEPTEPTTESATVTTPTSTSTSTERSPTSDAGRVGFSLILIPILAIVSRQF